MQRTVREILETNGIPITPAPECIKALIPLSQKVNILGQENTMPIRCKGPDEMIESSPLNGEGAEEFFKSIGGRKCFQYCWSRKEYHERLKQLEQLIERVESR